MWYAKITDSQTRHPHKDDMLQMSLDEEQGGFIQKEDDNERKEKHTKRHAKNEKYLSNRNTQMKNNKKEWKKMQLSRYKETRSQRSPVPCQEVPILNSTSKPLKRFK